MKIVKIYVQTTDHKFGNGSDTLSAISLEAAVKYLIEKYEGIVDETEQFFKDHPYLLGNDDNLIKYFTHTQNRYDGGGDWDYPIERKFSLYWEEVIE